MRLFVDRLNDDKLFIQEVVTRAAPFVFDQFKAEKMGAYLIGDEHECIYFCVIHYVFAFGVFFKEP